MTELGSDNGGMSTFFALQCLQRGIKFGTIDNQDWKWHSNGVPALLHLEEKFLHVDLFSEETRIFMLDFFTTRADHPHCVFFDDGNKPREWSIFAPMLMKGDFLVVHDWNSEFFPKDLGDVKVTPILENLFQERNGYQTRWFIKD